MKRPAPNPTDIAARQSFHAAQHLARGAVGESCQHYARGRNALLDQVCYAISNHARLARACARDHERSARRRGHSRELLVVQLGAVTRQSFRRKRVSPFDNVTFHLFHSLITCKQAAREIIKLRNADSPDCGMRISYCGLPDGLNSIGALYLYSAFQSAIRNPHSAIERLHSRLMKARMRLEQTFRLIYQLREVLKR